MKITRINRRTFAACTLLNFAQFFIISSISNINAIDHNTHHSVLFSLYIALYLFSAVYFLVTTIILSLKRVYDLGWHWLTVILFGLFTPLLVLLAILPGEKAKNKYGAVPSDDIQLSRNLMWWHKA